MANKNKSKTSRRTNPLFRPRPLILNDYNSDDETIPPSETQGSQNSVSHQDCRRTNIRSITENGLLEEMDAQNVQGLQSPPNNLFRNQDSSNLGFDRDNRRGNIRNTSANELLYETGSEHLQGLRPPPNNGFRNQDSPDLGSYRDNRRTNIRTTTENELVCEIRAQHLQGLHHEPPNDIFRNQDSPNIGSYRGNRRTNVRNSAENESVPETGAAHLQGLQQPMDNCTGKVVHGRGPYKGVELDKLTNGRKNKLIVFMEPGRSFSPLGEHRAKLTSWLGYCAKRFGPPKVSWSEVEKRHRSQLWSMVQDYFDVSSESPPKWRKLEEQGKIVPDSLE